MIDVRIERHGFTVEAYLDNSATSKVSDKVIKQMLQALSEDYGNPSSMHRMGVRAEQQIKDSVKAIGTALKVEAKELIFTSGGTEGNNLAIIGTALANQRRGKHIITTPIEHPSVLEAMEHLKQSGFEISHVKVDSYGKVVMEDLLNLLREDTILVSIMYVNNEIGAVQDIALIGEEIKKKNPNVIFHVDAVQAFGKYKIYPKREKIDLLTISGHKIHGPKGSGVLYINPKVKILPIMFGGGHQRGLRSGTENVPAIAGLGQAVTEAYENFDQKIDFMYQWKEKFITELLKFEDIKIHGISVNGQNEIENLSNTAPHVISASFMGVRSEVLLHSLEDKGIYVSSGSACSTHQAKNSDTLTSLGASKEEMESTIRFSISSMTTMEELDYTIQTIAELLPMLRRYTRKK